MMISLFFIGIVAAYSQRLTTTQIKTLDSLAQILLENNRAMGSFSVWQNGKEVYARTFGLANYRKSVPANENTLYGIGSMSKMYTAAIILQQVQANKLQLETTVAQYFPDLKNADKITIEHLLTHRSGIAEIIDLPDYASWRTNTVSRDSLVKKLNTLSANFTPGSNFGYSNTNFILLSLIAEKVDNLGYHELLKRYVTGPLKLHNTYFKEGNKHIAESYKYVTDWEFEPPTSNTVAIGAGGIIATASDLNKFLNAVFRGNYLQKNLVSKVFQFNNNHSLGFQEFTYENLAGIGHGGRIDGFESYGAYFPQQQTSIAFTSNALLYPLYDVWMQLVKIVFNKPNQLPVFEVASAEELDSFTGKYANPNFPFQFEFTNKKNQLILHAEGRSNALVYNGKNSFSLQMIGLELVFNSANGTMLFKQNGGEFLFTKVK